MSIATIQSEAGNVENYLFMDILSEKMTVGAMRGLTSTSRMIVKNTQEKIKEPKSGVKYKNLRVRSSKADEYPANQTGKLRRSIGFQLKGTRRSYIGARVQYSRFLAFGTRNMQKRRFIGNTIEDNIKEGYDMISNEINKELKI